MLWWLARRELKSSDRETRINTIQRLGRSGDRRALPLVLRHLDSLDAIEEKAAAEALGELHFREAVEPLVERGLYWKYNLHDDRIRSIAKCLARFGNRAVEALRPRVKAPDPCVRACAIRLLLAIPGDAAFALVWEALDDSARRVRTVAEDGLRWVPDAVPKAVDLLMNGDLAQSRKAAYFLARQEWQPATEAERARYAVARFDWQEVSRLGDLAQRLALDLLGPQLDDASVGPRLEAVYALGECGYEPAVEPLTERLADQNPVVRQAATRALARIRGEAITGPRKPRRCPDGVFRRIAVDDLLAQFPELLSDASLERIKRLGGASGWEDWWDEDVLELKRRWRSDPYEKLRAQVYAETCRREGLASAPDPRQLAVNQRLLALGLEPSPSGLAVDAYGDHGATSAAAIVGELHLILRNLGRIFGVSIDQPPRCLLDALCEAGAVGSAVRDWFARFVYGDASEAKNGLGQRALPLTRHFEAWLENFVPQPWRPPEDALR